MGVSKEDRKDYEQGVKDSYKGVLETAFNDIIVNHPDSSAYYKGRDRQQLDDDEKSNKK
jgi:hypothetical protein